MGQNSGTPLVSVVIPVYNVEDYLRECLESVLSQTLRDIEIICVDDGSTDDSPDILQEYAESDERISIYTKENEGVGGASARNLGLSKAVGKYVSILDSDDFFDLSMLEKAVIRAEETNADIVIFGGYEYDEKTHAKRKINGILNECVIPNREVFSRKDCSDDIFQITQGMAWNKLFRRSFLNRYGIKFQKIKFSDDAFFTFSHLALAERISVLREPLINYRFNSGRNQTDGIANYPDSSFAPYIVLKDFLEEKRIYDEIRKSFLNCACGFMKFCYDRIDRCDAFVYLHNKLRNEIFDIFGLAGYAPDVYYDRRVYMWVREVIENSAEEILFKSARGHGGADSTTGILRFRFPYELIPPNSRIVIVGDRVVGRHYMSQAVLSGRYDVVAWVDEDNPRGYRSICGYDVIESIDYDFVLISYTDRKKTDEAVVRLHEAGVPDYKILTEGDVYGIAF